MKPIIDNDSIISLTLGVPGIDVDPEVSLHAEDDATSLTRINILSGNTTFWSLINGTAVVEEQVEQLALVA